MSGIIGGIGSRSGIIGTTELDYEEGTWTAALVLTGGTAVFNSSYNTGAYTKIGRLVTVGGWFYLTETSTPSGVILLTGLPFTSGPGDQDSEYSSPTFGYLQSWDPLSSGHWITGHISGGGNQF